MVVFRLFLLAFEKAKQACERLFLAAIVDAGSIPAASTTSLRTRHENIKFKKS